MVISHDRWFLDRVSTHILAYEDNSKITFFEGNYTEYHQDFVQRYGTDTQPKRVKHKRLKD
jgi:ATPase subunit of ABC transporter with duplicated ATPase domains